MLKGQGPDSLRWASPHPTHTRRLGRGAGGQGGGDAPPAPPHGAAGRVGRAARAGPGRAGRARRGGQERGQQGVCSCLSLKGRGGKGAWSCRAQGQAAHAEVAWSVASEAGAPVEGGKGEEGFLCRWQVAGVQVDVSWLWLPWLACLK